jgi:predicted MFS family arabinose efflux permease
MNFQVLMPPFADNVLEVGAVGYGFLMAASGLGSTVAALGVAFTRRIGPLPIVAGAVALGLASIVLAVATRVPVSLVAMVVIGAGGIGMAVPANTTIQLSVPDQLRGRVMSVYTTVFAASVPAGGLLMGAVASSLGVASAVLLGGVLSLGVGVVSWYSLSRMRRGETSARTNRAEVSASASGETPLTVARRR